MADSSGTTHQADCSGGSMPRASRSSKRTWRWFAVAVTCFVLIVAFFAVDYVRGALRFEQQLSMKRTILTEFEQIHQDIHNLTRDGMDLRDAIVEVNRRHYTRHGGTLGWISTDPAAWQGHSVPDDAVEMPRFVLLVEVPDSDEPLFWVMDTDGVFWTTNSLGRHQSTFTALSLPPLGDRKWQP